MQLGFALTQHCNLRCHHCIRDDVTTVRALPLALVLQACDDAAALFGTVEASFTGGEPTLHPEWEALVDALRDRGIRYRLVTNGWHMKRLMRSMDRWPPAWVRVSLSGATAASHDAVRGRDSFRRVLLAIALLTSRQVPASLAFLVDRRSMGDLAAAAELAESLGCPRLHYVVSQPVPGTAARGEDLTAAEWRVLREEIAALAVLPRRTALHLDFGAPAPLGEPEALCDTMALTRAYVDAHGRLSLCCQLSDYGFNSADVVADLREERLADAWPRYLEAMAEHRAATDPRRATGAHADFPCLRCAARLGKLAWMREAS